MQKLSSCDPQNAVIFGFGFLVFTVLSCFLLLILSLRFSCLDIKHLHTSIERVIQIEPNNNKTTKCMHPMGHTWGAAGRWQWCSWLPAYTQTSSLPPRWGYRLPLLGENTGRGGFIDVCVCVCVSHLPFSLKTHRLPNPLWIKES